MTYTFKFPRVYLYWTMTFQSLVTNPSDYCIKVYISYINSSYIHNIQCIVHNLFVIICIYLSIYLFIEVVSPNEGQYPSIQEARFDSLIHIHI